MVSEKYPATELIFRLNVEDDWPPVAAECLPCLADGAEFEIQAPPFFIRDLSVGDRIVVTDEENGQVWSWKHQAKSNRSTVWVMTFGNTVIEEHLAKLQANGCNIWRFPNNKIFSIDIPPTVSPETLDHQFTKFNSNEIAIAFPSWRHRDTNVD